MNKFKRGATTHFFIYIYIEVPYFSFQKGGGGAGALCPLPDFVSALCPGKLDCKTI